MEPPRPVQIWRMGTRIGVWERSVRYEVSSYMKNSEECRLKAASASRADHRQQWLILAEAWQALADSAEQAFATALRVATVNVGASSREHGAERDLDGQRMRSVSYART